MKTTFKLGSLALVAKMLVSPSHGNQLEMVGGDGAAAPDSVVCVVAEMQGLQSVAYSDLPPFSTYWEAMPGGIMAPLPAPLFDPTLPIYAITDNAFIVDGTAGLLPVKRNQAALMSANSPQLAAAQDEATAVANLIERVQSATATTTASPMIAASALSASSSSPPSLTSNGTATPNDSTYTPPNYGTNLWIASPAVGSGSLTGIGSNTLADVQYTIQTCTDLGLGNWQNVGNILGSELTNWTALSVSQGSASNLFVRLRSEQSSDGSGIPDWWLSQYFGTNQVDPNAQDSAGDGYTIYHKYQLGVSPRTWVTPNAPQGVSVTIHQPSQTATISWLPASGPVTGYVVEKTDSYAPNGVYPPNPPTVTDVAVSGASTSYQDNISSNNRDPLNGYNYDLTYRVKAVYGANSSAWSATAASQPTVSAAVAPGANGTTYLLVGGIPASAVTVRLYFVDLSSSTNWIHDAQYDFTLNYPVSAFTNGLYQLTTPWPNTDGNGYAEYTVYADSIAVNGDESAASWFDQTWGESLQPLPPYNWGQPFYDGREQLKQNLIFQLRAASMTAPFSFSIPETNYNADNSDALSGGV